MITPKNLTTMLTRVQNLTTVLVTTVLHGTVRNLTPTPYLRRSSEVCPPTYTGKPLLNDSSRVKLTQVGSEG